MNFFTQRLAVGTSGERLLWLRSTLYKNRKEFCLKHDINQRTLLSWELGTCRITEKGAKKLIEAFNKEGIVCTFDWLAKGMGPAPESIALICKSIMGPEDLSYNNSIKNNIQNEAQIFMQLNPGAKVFQVPDDSMEPELFQHDLVGAIPLDLVYSKQILGSICAVETLDSHVEIKKIYPGPEPHSFNLSAINPHTKIPQPVIFNVTPSAIYKVIWIRRSQ